MVGDFNMNIIICDDNIAIVEAIKNAIKAEKNIPNLNIFTYNCPQRLLEDIESSKVFPIDLILLDIQLGEINGIEIASKIQFINNNIKIIFITGYETKYSQHIFNNVIPSGFITKPIRREILSSYINKIYLNSHEMFKIINLSNKMGDFSIPANEITYVESVRRNLKVHLKNNTFVFAKKLDDIADLFPPCFVRCHKSYIVNLNAIVKMEATYFILIDNSIISISKSMREKTREAYFKYKGMDLI